MTEVNLTEEIMDFSLPRGNIKFRLENDVFEAVPEIATELALEFVDDAAALEEDKISTREQLAVIKKLFHMVLLPESAERFVARLRDPANPIGPERFQRVLTFLMERYGLRPTEPDSDSSPGSDVRETGTSSMASANGEGSIFAA